ncbi:MAG: ribose 5-phosphate isomerase B [Armatimonadota bacterium]|nr:ribose 5-phosphate isomerase B [Armatimonadota bacterium]MDR7422903.1 ribose 5-phosphate isomerase B [Armatimonadota bacterium]MDR7452915.1 ribose 5-phosphate isomerase B [Armatimonadota bacterium]MDR7455662.1 ribose 5-phosphate isomerase B [Armatimonadota bacterium]MDR7497383.1 ribose 5-phosphate isomerase B [Armatimonadota bacterium]
MRVVIGGDHAGVLLKAEIARLLLELGHEVRDVGTTSPEPVDYPDYCIPAAEVVSRGEADRGIIFGGTGNGEAMAANKVLGIRCAVVHDVTTARLARFHNDANMIALGARIVGSEVAKEIVRTFLTTPFEGGRHIPRIEKIARYEREQRK